MLYRDSNTLASFQSVINSFYPKIKSASIGSGLGTDSSTQESIKWLISFFNEKKIPTVLDAVCTLFLVSV